MKKVSIYITSLLLLGANTSCEKYLTVDPPSDRLATNTVFTDSTSAVFALAGIYGNIVFPNTWFLASQMRWAGLSADELDVNTSTATTLQFRDNDLLSDNTDLNTHWTNLYTHIYQANSVIEGVKGATGITNAAKAVLIGEAKFIRTFLFFYLVNNWGDVPLTLSTDYKVNQSMPRTPENDVYAQMIDDLLEAQQTLPVDYPTTERVRPNKMVATALLARVYLYHRNWSQAEQMASQVIASGIYSPLPPLSTTFLKESNETIWQFYPNVNNIYNTYDGFWFVPASLTNATIPLYPLPATLYHSFDVADQRRNSWIGVKTAGPYYFPYKYKIRSNATSDVRTEYNIVLRLAEQYLIRAEARAQQNKLSEAIADLNVIRQRAGLGNLSTSLNQAEVIAAVADERYHELFCEWGHRWFDLKRTGRADAVLAPVKGSNWQSTDVLWPIPLTQMLNNPFLTQNDGY